MNKEVKQLVARFQSPQWGSNSKVMVDSSREVLEAFQSPQWGDNSKEKQNTITIRVKSFQSPQWEIILKHHMH